MDRTSASLVAAFHIGSVGSRGAAPGSIPLHDRIGRINRTDRGALDHAGARPNKRLLQTGMTSSHRHDQLGPVSTGLRLVVPVHLLAEQPGGSERLHLPARQQKRISVMRLTTETT